MAHPFIIALACLAVFLLLLRPVLHFALPRLAKIRTPKNLRERVMVRYQGKNFDAWMFAWFKTGLDPMFRELPEFLKLNDKKGPDPFLSSRVESFLDLGCGYGLAGCMLLEILPDSTAYAVDPNPARVSAAAAAMGDRGQVFLGSAPDFEKPGFPDHFDAAFALDMIHFLTDEELDITLQKIRNRLKNGDPLFIRSPVQPTRPESLKMKLYRLYAQIKLTSIFFRSVEQIRGRIIKAGFEMLASPVSGTNPELFWFIATASDQQEFLTAETQRRGEEQMR